MNFNSLMFDYIDRSLVQRSQTVRYTYAVYIQQYTVEYESVMVTLYMLEYVIYT